MRVNLKKILKLVVPPILPLMVASIVNYRKNAARRNTPDIELYKPLFSPWLSLSEEIPDYKQIQKRTIISNERLYVLRWAARQALGLQTANDQLCWFELGVYRGGTAGFLADIVGHYNRESAKNCLILRLFDTFKGMPETDKRYDYHKMGDFSDTSLEAVQQALGETEHVLYHPGLIPETFSGLERDKISFVHVDVDIYKSVMDSCEFVYPRLVSGGVVVFDDYGFPSCPGARRAVDMFFADKEEDVLVMSTGQAIVIKL